VREDYSPGGTAWDYFPHDHARSRAYRWNEDGLAGICDRHQRICFAVGLWNRRDPILKERLFGLTGSEGNHGEDVKEYYCYLDSTPTHSYMKFLYKYPQAEFPYSQGHDLWDDQDGFFYDVLHLPDDSRRPLKIRSLVGLIPLLAVQTLEPEVLKQHEGFRRRLEWFIQYRRDLTGNVACMRTPGHGERRLLAIVDGNRLRRVLKVMLDEREFLSPYGIRAISQVHRDQPYLLRVNGMEYRVDYEPGESSSGLFGGNSNWRGPIWFPINFLLVEALQKFHHYFGEDYKVECPTGSGHMMTLWEVAAEISRRLTRIFLEDGSGRRPVFGSIERFQCDPNWHDLIPFHEYFHGDTGAGVGASHQTGWTALVAKLLQQSGE
jgi:hypothetical protein